MEGGIVDLIFDLTDNVSVLIDVDDDDDDVDEEEVVIVITPEICCRRRLV
jgi:hypothetical protein